MNLRLVLLVLIFLTMGGCATVPLNDFPESAEDFNQPPAELISKYDSIKRGTSSIDLFVPMNEDAYPQIVERWDEPQQLENTKPERILMAGAGIAAMFVPGLAFGPSLVDIAIMSGILTGELGLIYLLTPQINMATWEKGDYKIDVTVTGKPGERHIQYWEWSHKNASCDCYRPIIPKRLPTAMYLDMRFSFSYSDVYLNRDELESDPSFNFEFTPSISYSIDSPFKSDLSLGIDFSRRSYSKAQLNFESTQQIGVHLAAHTPIAFDDRLRIGVGMTIPVVSFSRSGDEKYELTDYFPRYFVRADYAIQRHFSLGYFASYDQLDTTKGNRLQIDEWAFGTSLMWFF